MVASNNFEGYLKNNNKKGFTLIELLAVIVILAIIALIAAPIVLNMIEDARKSAVKDSAYGYVKSIENKVAQSALLGKEYEDRDDYAYEDIDVDLKGTKPTYVRFSLKKGIVESGIFCIDGYIVNYTNNEVTVGEACNENDLKLPGSVKLSSDSGNYQYPHEEKFKVTENISGGELSCTSDNTNVATCSINRNTVTVIPGTTEGSATLTIKSASTSKYQDAQAAHVVITAKGTIPSVTVNGYEGTYDGLEHGITVSTTLDGATIKYGTVEGTYNLTTNPTYKDVGEYTTYYEISKEGYNTITGNEKVVITKAEGSIIAPTAKTLTYTGSVQTLINVGSSNTGEIQYKLNDGTYSTSIPSAINAETYTIYYQVIGDENHENVDEKSITVTIAKANNTLTLSSESGNYTYPTSGTFTITKNISGGKLSCTSSNTAIATCSISGTTVTVVPGTTSGSATLTISSDATTNYNAVQASHVANTAKGTIPSITANGYTGTEDGAYHGITVSTTLSGATIKYGTSSGSYTTTTNPTYKSPGTYTVYYQISKAGYTTVTGSKQVIINSETRTAPTRSSTTSNSSSITAVYNAGSATSGIASTNCYRTNSSGTVQANGTLSGNNCVFSGLSSNTTYYYKKCITSKAGNTSCSGVSSILTAGGVTNFGYTGGQQTYTTPCKGTFKLETWGAQGGSYNSTYHGGYGGYATGMKTLSNGTTLYVNVGGQGGSATTLSSTVSAVGGYNGGGTSNNSDIAGAASGGGGATHIATRSGILSSLSSYKSNILIVAGGGGGGFYYSWSGTIYNAVGGSGGGTSGGVPSGQIPYGVASAGTQTSGAAFGQGANGSSMNDCGGGGGYYGGTTSNAGGAAGGSGYIGGVTSGSMTNGSRSGSGYARITVSSCTN